MVSVCVVYVFQKVSESMRYPHLGATYKTPLKNSDILSGTIKYCYKISLKGDILLIPDKAYTIKSCSFFIDSITSTRHKNRLCNWKYQDRMFIMMKSKDNFYILQLLSIKWPLYVSLRPISYIHTDTFQGSNTWFSVCEKQKFCKLHSVLKVGQINREHKEYIFL